MLIVLILLIALMEALAQYFIKKFNQLPHTLYYLLGVGFYAIVAFLLNKSYDYSSMGMCQILWSGMSVISILAVGSLVFGETIEMNEWIGVLFIISGIIITQIKNFV